jgi:hypothetical protein
MSGKNKNENLSGFDTQILQAETEQTLRASELSHRRLFEAAKGRVWVLDEGQPGGHVFK